MWHTYTENNSPSEDKEINRTGLRDDSNAEEHSRGWQRGKKGSLRNNFNNWKPDLSLQILRDI